MTAAPKQPAFSFHIEGSEPNIQAVPATVLVQILENAQRAFELIGVHVEGRGIKERARVSSATSHRFQMVCQVPVSGSYALPVTIGGTDELFSMDLANKAFDIFRKLMEQVSAHCIDGLVAALPDDRIRRRVLESVKGMSPRADAQWKLSLYDDQNVSFATFDVKTIPFVENTLVSVEQREAARIVTGELKSIDFTERKITIIYPPTSKELVCIYEESVEDLLYEKRRDLIQVTGRVLLDEQGTPKQIIDVTDIRDLDLSTLVIDAIRHGTLFLKATSALSLEPTLDESKQLLCIEKNALGIDVYATTREALLAELQEQLAMLWQEYAQASDEELDAPARQLKQALLKRFSEVAHAA
ncbi:MAG: hypothetical protein HOP04_02090 [Methylophilaceae bacterium]|nr:hypothetical protein [Methylophilaceae bacterium]